MHVYDVSVMVFIFAWVSYWVTSFPPNGDGECEQLVSAVNR